MNHPSEKRQRQLNRQQMEEVIRSGGSILYNGRIYTSIDGMPIEADFGEAVDATSGNAHELILQEEKAIKNFGVGMHIQSFVGDFHAKGHYLENASWLIASYFRGAGMQGIKKLSAAAALIAMEIDTVLQTDTEQKAHENLIDAEKRKSQFETIREEAEKLIDEKIGKARSRPEEVKSIIENIVSSKVETYARKVIGHTDALTADVKKLSKKITLLKPKTPRKQPKRR